MEEIINFPKIMGILNVTPDSFSDGGEYLNQDNALANRLGVTREQLMETLGICTYMGGGPSLMYAAEAVRAYDEFVGTA